MMNRILQLLPLCALCLLFTACSTPETRIKGNLEAFNAATAEQQDLIKQGRVGLGFTPELVRLAIGDPDSIKSRVDEKGSSEIWLYTTWESDTGVYLYSGYYHRSYAGYYPYYGAYPGRRSKEMARVVFKESKVVAVEAQIK